MKLNKTGRVIALAVAAMLLLAFGAAQAFGRPTR